MWWIRKRKVRVKLTFWIQQLCQPVKTHNMVILLPFVHDYLSPSLMSSFSFLDYAHHDMLSIAYISFLLSHFPSFFSLGTPLLVSSTLPDPHLDLELTMVRKIHVAILSDHIFNLLLTTLSYILELWEKLEYYNSVIQSLSHFLYFLDFTSLFKIPIPVLLSLYWFPCF